LHPTQKDTDGDEVGDKCDNCPEANADQKDTTTTRPMSATRDACPGTHEDKSVETSEARRVLARAD
jgi:hypothetical protein